MTKHLFNIEIEKRLRQGKASELIAGGIWYFKDEKGDFKRVENDIENLGPGFRTFCEKHSRENNMYLFIEKPNYSYTESAHKFDQVLIDKYAKK
jgi:hypothetical protein